MAKQVPVITYEVTNGAKPVNWGRVNLTKAGEILLTASSTIYDLQDDWALTTLGTAREGLKIRGTIKLTIENFNGHTITVFGQQLTASNLNESLLVELTYDKYLNPNVVFSKLPGVEDEEDPIATLAIGDRQYTEENYVTSDETLTASVDSLDIAIKIIENSIGGISKVYTASNLVSGITNIVVEPTTIAYGAYIDYALLSIGNIPLRIGTIYTTWNNLPNGIVRMDYTSTDLNIDTSNIVLETVNTGTYFIIRTSIRAGIYNVKLIVRYI